MLVIFFLFSIFSNTYDLVYLVKINTSINPASSNFIIENIELANKDIDAKLFVIELNTPGGLVTSTRNLVQSILNSKIPIAVNVTPSGAHAGSAGVMITLASHVAAMAPATNIGAAHPVSLIPNFSKNDDKDKANENISEEKAINDLSAFVKSIAKARNRNEVWAVESISKNATLIPEDALKLKVIDFIVNDTNELISVINNFIYIDIDKEKKQIKLNNPKIIVKEMSLKEKIINFFADPNFAFFLMIIAALGIYIEFSNPGLILPGVFGGISFILFLMSTQVLPISATAIVLILLGLVLIILEFFIVSGFLAVGGSISLILGGVFFINPIDADLSVSSSFLWPLAFLLLISVSLLSYLIYKTKKQKIGKSLSSTMGVLVRDEIIYAKLIEYDNVNKKGRVQINSELWNFISDDILEIGETVVIKERQGLTLRGGKKDV